MRFVRPKHIILAVAIALGVWALLPPRAPQSKAAGSSPASAGGPLSTVVGDDNATFRLRINPGSLYLPGVVLENSTKPIEGITKVARDFVALHPDTRIEFVGAATGQREWLVTQVSSGQAPDIIQINVEDVWQDIQKNWYVPLDRWLEKPNPYVDQGAPGSQQWWDQFKYPIPTNGTRAPDGKMYCCVLDMIETGIFYNKTIFKKLGLREPADWEEFLAIQNKLQDAHYTPMLVDKGALTDWGVDLVFDQLYYDLRPLLDLDYDPRRGEYLHGYLDWDEIIFLHNRGFFTPADPRWREQWKILKDWRRYMAQDLSSTDFEKAFITQRGAMLWSTSMFVNRLVNDPDREFEWGIFYLPPIKSSFNRFAKGRQMCVIGGSAMQYSITNSALSDTPADMPFEERIEQSERLKRVVAWLQFLTIPKNCDRVVNESIALLPNTKGVDPHPALAPFDRFLQRHYSMTKWRFTFDLQFDENFVRMFELYLNGGMTDEQFMNWMDRNINAASDKIVKRKNLDLSRFEKVWAERKQMRQEYQELPQAARSP